MKGCFAKLRKLIVSYEMIVIELWWHRNATTVVSFSKNLLRANVHMGELVYCLLIICKGD